MDLKTIWRFRTISLYDLGWTRDALMEEMTRNEFRKMVRFLDRYAEHDPYWDTGDEE